MSFSLQDSFVLSRDLRSPCKVFEFFSIFVIAMKQWNCILFPIVPVFIYYVNQRNEYFILLNNLWVIIIMHLIHFKSHFSTFDFSIKKFYKGKYLTGSIKLTIFIYMKNKLFYVLLWWILLVSYRLYIYPYTYYSYICLHKYKFLF